MSELHGWLGRNSLRSFPLQENASVVSEKTGWSIPNSLIVDFFAAVPGGRACITCITVTPMIVSVVIGNPDTGETLATASVTSGEATPFVSKPLVPIAPGVAGNITFGSLFEGPRPLPVEMLGQHIFGATTLLESRCLIDPGPFPVNSLSPLRGEAVMSGEVSLESNTEIAIGLSQGEDDGDPLSVISLDLTSPSRFVSPCETRESPCQCRSMPIMSINGVLPDSDGKITVELVDENGHIVLAGESLLNVLLLRSANAVCVRPLMPDDSGRLPDRSGSYDADQKPVTPYKNPSDTGFPDPYN